MQIEAMELTSGDPCYSTDGHVDKQAFLQEIYIRFGEEFEESDVWHAYHTPTQPERMKGTRDKPKRFDGERYFWFCGKDDPGAIPVTVAHP